MTRTTLLHLPPFFSSAAPPPTAIYTLSLHDALPIFARVLRVDGRQREVAQVLAARLHRLGHLEAERLRLDRKSTRLNSSHVEISYAVFCLKKKIEAAEDVGEAGLLFRPVRQAVLTDS